MIISVIVAGLICEGLVALYAFKWAHPKSNAVFFGVFAAEAAVRLAGLMFLTWWLLAKQIPFVAPLLTLGLGYLATSMLQIPFLYKAH